MEYALTTENPPILELVAAIESEKGINVWCDVTTAHIKTLRDAGSTDFSRLKCPSVDFTSAIAITRHTFENARFQTFYAQNTQFGSCNFKWANMHADFRGAHLAGCSFDDATLIGSDFRGATIRGCTFVGAELFDAMFWDAPIERHLSMAFYYIDNRNTIEILQGKDGSVRILPPFGGLMTLDEWEASEAKNNPTVANQVLAAAKVMQS